MFHPEEAPSRIRHGGADSRPDRGRARNRPRLLRLLSGSRTQAERDRFQIPLLYPLLRRKYFLDDLYWYGIVQPIKGPDRPGGQLDQHLRDRRDRQRGGGGDDGPVEVRLQGLDQSGIDGVVHGLSLPPMRPGARRCGVFRPGGCSSMRRGSWSGPVAGAGGRGFPIGEGLIPMELLNEWGLTAVVFLPALGALVLMAVPQVERDRDQAPGDCW